VRPPSQHPFSKRPFYDPASELSPEEGIWSDCEKNCPVGGKFCGGLVYWFWHLTSWQRKALLAFVLAVIGVILVFAFKTPVPGIRPGPTDTVEDGLPKCSFQTPCPPAWSTAGGGYYCQDNGGCQQGAQGAFPNCKSQCVIGHPPKIDSDSNGGAGGNGPLQPKTLTEPGNYDLRVLKGGKLLGCAAPIGIFPGNEKYGCSGPFATAQTCDAVSNPVRDTDFVKAVHDGCETAKGEGTYGYAYDDGVGLKQCSPVTRYEWVLCPTGAETKPEWTAEAGKSEDSTKRFRITNRCDEPVWIMQAAGGDKTLPSEDAIIRIESNDQYTYSIPNKGLPSMRFLPKTGCDVEGNNCEIQSMPPCPAAGCDLPIDTKFEASWGCLYAKGLPEDKDLCSLTGQGHPSTYQDWWDGSAVDGWTLPFSILVNDENRGLTQGTEGSPDICGPVKCFNLQAERLCPRSEFLTPES